ncbi:hypothetical protein [Rhizobium sp. Root482]|uniref:hypothetical protein n=1 Tax=Rhizobium sp. Root482 TaxID=1736543 RepID=UPI0012E3B3A4|nr:hypothetical protein [Rhizobium sp. Root482]
MIIDQLVECKGLGKGPVKAHQWRMKMSKKMLAIAAMALGLATAPAFAQSATVDMNTPGNSDECQVPGADNVNCREKMEMDSSTTGSIMAPAMPDDGTMNTGNQNCTSPGADNVNCQNRP